MNKNSSSKLNTINREEGFASLLIASIIIVVLGLLTVGFAELMRHNQEQTLNRQLSDQAYYAAESGINDALHAIKDGFTGEKSFCGPYGQDGNPAPANLAQKDLSDNTVSPDASQISAKWTCLLVSSKLPSLEYDSVGTTVPKVFVVQPVDSTGANISLSQLSFYWQGTDGSTNFNPSACSGSACFPKAGPGVGDWSYPGVLRVSITRFAPSAINRQSLIDNTYTAFLYPNSDGMVGQFGTSSFTPGYTPSNGPVVNGECNADNKPLFCRVDITGLATTPTNEDLNYLVTLRAVYSDVHVIVQGPNDVDFSGPAVVVDSTGKSLNVLKRLRIQVPIHNKYAYPGFGAETTGSICKLLSTYPGASNTTLNCP